MHRTKNTIVAIAIVVLLAGGVVFGTGETRAENDSKKHSSEETSSERKNFQLATEDSDDQEELDSEDGVLGDVDDLSDSERLGSWDADESQDEITADVLGITADEWKIVQEGNSGLDMLAEDDGYLNAEEYLRIVRSAIDETGYHLVDS